jgi:hypothetical protein
MDTEHNQIDDSQVEQEALEGWLMRMEEIRLYRHSLPTQSQQEEQRRMSRLLLDMLSSEWVACKSV